jgi:hypothetical protein
MLGMLSVLADSRWWIATKCWFIGERLIATVWSLDVLFGLVQRTSCVVLGPEGLSILIERTLTLMVNVVDLAKIDENPDLNPPGLQVSY